MLIIVILMIASILSTIYFYITKGFISAILYGIYAMLVILIYVFAVKAL